MTLNGGHEDVGRLVRGLLAMELGHQFIRQLLLQIHRIDRIFLQAAFYVLELGVGDIRQALEIGHHEVVGKGHSLAVHIAGRLVDANVVPEALAHLLHAVGAGQQRHQEALLRALAHLLLEIPPDQQVEPLVGAPELDVGLDHHRVIGLEQRVQQLRDGDWLVGLIASGEVLAGQELRHREPARQLDDIGQ